MFYESWIAISPSRKNPHSDLLTRTQLLFCLLFDSSENEQTEIFSLLHRLPYNNFSIYSREDQDDERFERVREGRERNCVIRLYSYVEGIVCNV
jgi:hypothetical protein